MTFEIYHRLTMCGWRFFWRLRAANHRIIAVGGEGFHNKGDVYAIIQKMVNELDAAQIEEIK
jgi:uncharacterized protein YegP (UPF0339 family)